MSEANNNITTEYIQFSKRITKLGVIMVTFALVACLAAITVFNISPELAITVSQLYSAYVTIMGITIGAYQGNSSLEKWTKARYNFSQATDQDIK